MWALRVIGSVLLLALPLFLMGNGQERAPESVKGAAGTWHGDAITVKWRQRHRTLYRPELLVVTENISNKRVAIHVEWTPRTCEGRKVSLRAEARSFVGDLYSGDTPIHGGLRAGEWDAFMFPYGDNLFGENSSFAKCQTKIAIRALVEEREVDKLIIEASSPAQQ